MSNAMEIERKFLAARCPPIEDADSETVRQGYLTEASDSVEVRLRQKGSGYFMTVKSKGTLQRSEHEAPISRESFDALWPATASRRIEKVRYTDRLPDGQTFELDIFQGALAPLMVVEVEFSSVDAANAFTPPEWFGQDVTSDARYKNKALATLAAPPVGTSS